MQRLLLLCACVIFISGCVTVGKPFPKDYAAQIVIGQTTRAEVERNLGVPFRTGLDSGDQTATYLYYSFGVFSTPVTMDLTIRYNPEGTIKSYTFNSN
jgi:hypothetical protein